MEIVKKKEDGEDWGGVRERSKVRLKNKIKM